MNNIFKYIFGIIALVIGYLIYKKLSEGPAPTNGGNVFDFLNYGKMEVANDGFYPNGETNPNAPFNSNHIATHLYNVMDGIGITGLTSAKDKENAWDYLLILNDNQLRNIGGSFYKQYFKKTGRTLTQMIDASKLYPWGLSKKQEILKKLKSLNA